MKELNDEKCEKEFLLHNFILLFLSVKTFHITGGVEKILSNFSWILRSRF